MNRQGLGAWTNWTLPVTVPLPKKYVPLPSTLRLPLLTALGCLGAGLVLMVVLCLLDRRANRAEAKKAAADEAAAVARWGGAGGPVDGRLLSLGHDAGDVGPGAPLMGDVGPQPVSSNYPPDIYPPPRNSLALVGVVFALLRAFAMFHTTYLYAIQRSRCGVTPMCHVDRVGGGVCVWDVYVIGVWGEDVGSV